MESVEHQRCDDMKEESEGGRVDTGEPSILSYPILSSPVLPSPLTCDFLEWISITEIPTLLNRDARYPVCLAVGRNTIT
jgi:hypothetical protein